MTIGTYNLWYIIVFETKITYFTQFVHIHSYDDKKYANIHIWNCRDETQFSTPILNVFKTMYILYNILIDIYHCSDCLLLLYYNKNETEFLAPQWKII